jgi:AcrR family transcriptional regulator
MYCDVTVASSWIMTDPKSLALERCLDAAMEHGRLDLGLRDYERLTGTSARMLVHHFGSKTGLEAALLAEIERRLLAEVLEALARDGAEPMDVVRNFQRPDRANLRRLLRLLVGRAFSGDREAARVLRDERFRWRDALSHQFSSPDKAEQALLILVGGAIDTMLGEL